MELRKGRWRMVKRRRRWRIWFCTAVGWFGFRTQKFNFMNICVNLSRGETAKVSHRGQFAIYPLRTGSIEIFDRKSSTIPFPEMVRSPTIVFMCGDWTVVVEAYWVYLTVFKNNEWKIVGHWIKDDPGPVMVSDTLCPAVHILGT